MSNAQATWERFDDISKPEDVVEAKTQRDPVEEGVYEVTLEEINPSENKNNLPMLKGKFRIKENNRLLFYNQNLQVTGYQSLTDQNIADAILMVEGLLGEEIEYKGLGALGQLVSTIPVGSDHWVQVTYANKDTEKKFPNLRIVEAPEGVDMGDANVDDDIPF